MSATVVTLRCKHRVAEPDPAMLAYAPPFPTGLKDAMHELSCANSAAQSITSGSFTTVGKARSLPAHLRRIIAAAEVALIELGDPL